MSFLEDVSDVILGRFRWWRRRRGLVWELWNMEHGGTMWFHCDESTAELQIKVDHVIDSYPEQMRYAARLVFFHENPNGTRPAIGAHGTPIVEDYRG